MGQEVTLLGDISLLLEDSLKGDKFKGDSRSLSDRGEVLIALHLTTLGQLERGLSAYPQAHFPHLPSSPALCPVPPLPCAGGCPGNGRPENNACPWPESAKVACNLHQQDLPLRFPHSELLTLTPTWKCQGPKEARKCVICPTSPELVPSIGTIVSSGHQPRPSCSAYLHSLCPLPVCFSWFPGLRGVI